MKRTQFFLLLTVVLLTAVLLVGCGQNRTKISSILGDTDAYVDRNVWIGGTVTQVYAANLIIAEAGAYQVDDGTGKLWVITKNGVPREGDRVAVKGTVSSGLRLGRETLGAVLRELERQTD